MGAMLASSERILRIVSRTQIYEELYTIKNTPQAIFDNFQSALLDLYETCLELLANSSHLFSKNFAAQTLNTILHPGETKDLFDKLETLEKRLNSEIQACEAYQSNASNTYLVDLLKSLDAPLSRIEKELLESLDLIEGTKRIEILEWISPIAYGKHHVTVKEARTPGTCQWLLKREDFCEWEESNNSCILWLRGSRKYSSSLVSLESEQKFWLLQTR
jgi:ankyrin repeat domain-containing protein 50